MWLVAVVMLLGRLAVPGEVLLKYSYWLFPWVLIIYFAGQVIAFRFLRSTGYWGRFYTMVSNLGLIAYFLIQPEIDRGQGYLVIQWLYDLYLNTPLPQDALAVAHPVWNGYHLGAAILFLLLQMPLWVGSLGFWARGYRVGRPQAASPPQKAVKTEAPQKKVS
jgi:hypothetical protein